MVLFSIFKRIKKRAQKAKNENQKETTKEEIRKLSYTEMQQMETNNSNFVVLFAFVMFLIFWERISESSLYIRHFGISYEKQIEIQNKHNLN